MVQDIFIGVDGGASKTKVVVLDKQNNLLGEALGAAAVIRVDHHAAWREILQTIDNALTQAQIKLTDPHYRFHAGMGLTGCEITESYQNFINTPHPFANLVVVKDSYAGCLAAHAGRDGAIIIVGTGTVGVAIQGEEMIQVAGWGFPHDDQGSGAWFGLQAVSLTLQWQDGRLKEKSELLEKILQKFDGDFDKLVIWANTSRATQFAQITPLVFEALTKQDAIAIQLVKRAASYVDAVYAALGRRTNNSLPCALFGGVVPFIKPFLGTDLLSHLVPQQQSPEYGAVLALKRKMKNQ